MYCSIFKCTMSTEVCLQRQEKAKNQSDTAVSYCESLIFCCVCKQGEKARKMSKRVVDLDVMKLRRDMIKDLLAKGDYRMFKIKRINLKRVEKIKKLQLKKRG